METTPLRYFPPVQTHMLASKYVEQIFKIEVMLPLQEAGETTRFPVIYVTDGNMTFDMFKGISYVLQSSEQSPPRYILVAIGYPGDSPSAGAMLRGRDLLFPGYPELKRKPPSIEGVLLAEKGTKDYGAAEDFQRFIEHELIPLIEREFGPAPNDRTYFGHSAGGGFGLFTLLSKPHLFSNYIISSPGLIYHGESSAGVHYENYDFLPQMVRRFLDSGASLNGIRLHMSVGTEEEFEPGTEQWHLTSSFYRMVALLKGAAMPGLTLTTKVVPEETHLTMWPIAFTQGVQAIFGGSHVTQRQALRSQDHV